MGLPEVGKARAVWVLLPEIKECSKERIGRTGSSLDDWMNTNRTFNRKRDHEGRPVLWRKARSGLGRVEFALMVRHLGRGTHWTMTNVEPELRGKIRAGNVDLEDAR